MSRKYSQKGYMDNGGGERRREQRPGPRPPREGPRGRGLGKPTATVFRCQGCGQQRISLDPVALDETCSKCGADLHGCVHCSQFDPGARFQCRQNVPAAVSNKRRRNECNLFAPKLTQEMEPGGGRSADDPRSAFDALFDF